MTNFDRLRDLLEDAVIRRVAPGGVVVVGDAGRDLATVPFGQTNDVPPPAPQSVSASTVYDIASLTKPVATTAVLMKLVAAGAVELDAPALRWLPELQNHAGRAVTLRQLVGHAAGYPAHEAFYERLGAGERLGASSSREALLCMAAATALAYTPGTEALYSDIGYILLGFALERAAGARLDELVARFVTGPLGMHATHFCDSAGAPGQIAGGGAVAPTRALSRRDLLVGEVHDDNARAAGGVVGHAGLFSCAADLSRFARAMVAAAQGIGHGGFAPEVVEHFFATSAAPGTTWRLGWDRPAPAPGVSQAGDRWPRDGLGHLGFTGCSLWLDPGRGRYAILLTNRVYYDPNPPAIKELRRRIMDEVVATLDAPSHP